MAGESKRPEQQKQVEQRQTSGEEIPPNPVLRRRGNRRGAGADAPAGPFPRSTTGPAKRERARQGGIRAQERSRKAGPRGS
jgi:hypothetical protein